MPSSEPFNFLCFDIYSKRITFFYDNKEKIGSYFGLSLTLTYILASIVLFIYYLVITIQRKEMKVYESTLYSEETPSLEINSSLVYFAFGIEDYSSSSRFIDETIYYPKILYIHRVKENGQFKTKINKELPYERCNESNFGIDYQKFFYEGELNTSYCLQNYNLTLAGGFKYDKLSYIRLKIFPCVNTTENNNHCKPREIIDKHISGAYLSLVIKDVGFNPSNFSTPVISTIQDLYTTIDKQIFRDFILYFGLSEIHSDTGLFNEIIHKEKYLKYRKQQQSFYFRDQSEYEKGKEVCVIQIRLDDSINIQKRSYTKLPEIFSKIGGYMQLMSTVFSILSIIVNKIGPEIKILNGIFNFNLEKNKMMMKVHSLKDFNLHILQRKSKNQIVIPYRESKKLKKERIITHNSGKKCLTGINNNDSISPITVINNKDDTNDPIDYKIKYNKNSENIKISLIQSKSNKDNKNKRLSAQFKMSVDDNDIENKDYNNSIYFNLLDYYCLRKLTSKKKEIELFNKGSSLYRKRMDIINVFTLLLLTERKLLNNEKKIHLKRENESPIYKK